MAAPSARTECPVTRVVRETINECLSGDAKPLQSQVLNAVVSALEAKAALIVARAGYGYLSSDMYAAAGQLRRIADMYSRPDTREEK